MKRNGWIAEIRGSRATWTFFPNSATLSCWSCCAKRCWHSGAISRSGCALRPGRNELCRRGGAAGMFAGNGGFAAASGAGDAEDEIELSEMHEIDPQSGDLKSDARLGEALRGLAPSSGRGAPAELGADWRRHPSASCAAQAGTPITIGTIAAGLAVGIGLVSLGSRSAHQVPGKEIVREQP